jgi:hypothetical protein
MKANCVNLIDKEKDNLLIDLANLDIMNNTNTSQMNTSDIFEDLSLLSEPIH